MKTTSAYKKIYTFLQDLTQGIIRTSTTADFVISNGIPEDTEEIFYDHHYFLIWDREEDSIIACWEQNGEINSVELPTEQQHQQLLEDYYLSSLGVPSRKDGYKIYQ